MRTFLAVAALIFVALIGCGKTSYPDKPQITPDRAEIGFGQEFGSGTYIGTKPTESLYLENGGLQNLEITSVTKSGGDTGAFTVNGPTETTVKGLGKAFVQVVFAPPAVKCYATWLTIESNAENTPRLVIPVSGRGVDPASDAGYITCPRPCADGGLAASCN